MANQSDNSNPESEQSGYVIAMTALLMVPMIVLAAFAVDVASWYTSAIKLQNAADAAALASVVYMPDEPQAIIQAQEILLQNGFDVDPASANQNATMVFIGDGNDVRIELSTLGDLYFAQAFLNNVNIERAADAEYIEPVRMGNPTSGLGTGNLSASSDVGTQPADGFWLAINHQCQRRANGDPFVQYIPGRYDNSNNCVAPGGAAVNPVGSLPPASGGAGWDGYVFVIDLPAALGTTSSTIEIRNPGWCDNLGAEPDIETFMYAPDETHQIASDNLADPHAGHIIWDADTQNANCGWRTIRTVPGPDGPDQRWYLRILSSPAENDDTWINTFSLRVRPGSTTGLCSSASGTACPNIYALEWLPIYRPRFDDAAGNPIQTAEFFLADVGAFHEGKTLELTLFDPGEGMTEIRILNPNGVQEDFQWRRANTSVLGAGGTNGTWASEDTGAYAVDGSGDWVSGCISSPCLNVENTKFNGDALQIQIDLTGYTCQTLPGGENCWWKVEYFSNGNTITDRTTWKTRIIGDPVRLTD